MFQVARAWLSTVEMPTFFPRGHILSVSEPQILEQNKGTSPGSDRGKEEGDCSWIQLLAATAASVLSVHLPTNTQMCGCFCTETMNNNARGKRSRREGAGEKEALTYQGGEEQDQQGGSFARKETKAPTAVTWLGRAERRELPVKTLRGKGKGFKGAVA